MKLNELRPAKGATQTAQAGRARRGLRQRRHGRQGAQGPQGPFRRRQPPPGSRAGRCRCSAGCPKGGFKNINRVEYQVVNVGDLNRFDAGHRGRPWRCSRSRTWPSKLSVPVKLLGDGALDRAGQGARPRRQRRRPARRSRRPAARSNCSRPNPEANRCCKACSRSSGSPS